MIIYVHGGYSTEPLESGFQPTTVLQLILSRLSMASILLHPMETF